MPRFFFNLREAAELVDKDDEGQECQDLKSAHATAIESARELLAEKAASGEAGDLKYQIEVVDEAGIIVFRVPVGRAVDSPAQR